MNFFITLIIDLSLLQDKSWRPGIIKFKTVEKIYHEDNDTANQIDTMIETSTEIDTAKNTNDKEGKFIFTLIFTETAVFMSVCLCNRCVTLLGISKISGVQRVFFRCKGKGEFRPTKF